MSALSRADEQPRPVIGPLSEAGRASTAGVLARAFRDNPLNRAVIASDDPARRLRSNLHGMRALLPVAHRFGNVSIAQLGDRVVGALISSPPDRFPLPPPTFVPRLRCLMGQGLQVARRWGDVFEALELMHPIEPHWYLGTIGVDPPEQQRGVGVALVERWLAEVDRDGLPAYLETDREANIAFYERSGFRVKEETSVLAVPVWCMERPAAKPLQRGAHHL